jgi:hypothetical protein
MGPAGPLSAPHGYIGTGAFLTLRVSLALLCFQTMAKKLRQNVQAGHHGAGTHKKKIWAKKKAGGKQRKVDRDKACEACQAAAWALKVPTIITTPKTERGESLTTSSSRMVLIVTMNIVNDRGIIIEKGKRNIKGIDGAFAEAARISSVGRETIRAVFYSWAGSLRNVQRGGKYYRGLGKPLGGPTEVVHHANESHRRLHRAPKLGVGRGQGYFR